MSLASPLIFVTLNKRMKECFCSHLMDRDFWQNSLLRLLFLQSSNADSSLLYLLTHPLHGPLLYAYRVLPFKMQNTNASLEPASSYGTILTYSTLSPIHVGPPLSLSCPCLTFIHSSLQSGNLGVCPQSQNTPTLSWNLGPPDIATFVRPFLALQLLDSAGLPVWTEWTRPLEVVSGLGSQSLDFSSSLCLSQTPSYSHRPP